MYFDGIQGVVGLVISLLTHGNRRKHKGNGGMVPQTHITSQFIPESPTLQTMMRPQLYNMMLGAIYQV